MTKKTYGSGKPGKVAVKGPPMTKAGKGKSPMAGAVAAGGKKAKPY